MKRRNDMNVSAGYGGKDLNAYGDPVLTKKDFAYWADRPELTDPAGVVLGLDEEVEIVEEDVFDLLPTLSSLWIENPRCRLPMTEKIVQLFQKNNVLLRGTYDSAAEKLARKYHLRFLPLDVKLAAVGDYFERGRDVITLCFRMDGSVYIHEDCMTQGISAGSMGGGETSFDLPKDFYLKMTAEEIADQCWGRCYSAILENGTLASFIKKAQKKNGILLDFTEK